MTRAGLLAPLALLGSLALSSSPSLAQSGRPGASGRATTRVTLNGNQPPAISIDYGQPHARGRTVNGALAGDIGTVFHLTNSSSPSMREFLRATFEWAGMREPRPVSDYAELTVLDQKLDADMEFYGKYFNHSKLFDRTNTEAITGTESTYSRMGEAEVVDLLAWYRERIEADGRSLFPARVSFAYRPPTRVNA